MNSHRTIPLLTVSQDTSSTKEGATGITAATSMATLPLYLEQNAVEPTSYSGLSPDPAILCRNDADVFQEPLVSMINGSLNLGSGKTEHQYSRMQFATITNKVTPAKEQVVLVQSNLKYQMSAR